MASAIKEHHRSDRLSWYRTDHCFDYVADAHSIEEIKDYLAYAQHRRLRVLIIGNGSNILFRHKNVRTFVIRNQLDHGVTHLKDDLFEVTSATPVMTVIKHCHKESRDCFYYLSSVPATIGGALAMNAGRGKTHGLSIYDFVESVTFMENGTLTTCRRDELDIGYRHTRFTGAHPAYIVSAVFRFPSVTLKGNPMLERITWAQEHQDSKRPNCGSVFADAYGPILSLMKRLPLTIRGCRYSRKTANWIVCDSGKSAGIVWLIRITVWLHRLLGRRARVELVMVD